MFAARIALLLIAARALRRCSYCGALFVDPSERRCESCGAPR
jgi:rubrerythrin